MIPLARWHRCVLAGLLLSMPSTLAAHAGEPEMPTARMPAWVVVKPGKANPEMPRPVEPTSFVVEVGPVDPKSQITIEMEIRNTSPDPVRILGGDKGCSPLGCINVLGPFPRIVPPGESNKVTAFFWAPSEASRPGDRSFQLDAKFYVGAGKTFSMPFQVLGSIKSEK